MKPLFHMTKQLQPLASILMVLLSVTVLQSHAQNYPKKPIVIIVPAIFIHTEVLTLVCFILGVPAGVLVLGAGVPIQAHA